MRDAALERGARGRERDRAPGAYRGPLHGIPYGVKDLLATRACPPPGARRPTASRCSTTTPPWSSGCARRARPGRQARDGRAGRRHGLQPRRRLVHRARAHAVEHRASGAAAPRAARAPRSRPGWCRSRSARRPRARSSRRPRSAASPACGRPTASSAVTARWRCAGRSTSSARWRAPPTTARSCSPRSPGQDPRDDEHAWPRASPTPTRGRARSAGCASRCPKGVRREGAARGARELRERRSTMLRRGRRRDARRRVARLPVGARGVGDRRRRGRVGVPRPDRVRDA